MGILNNTYAQLSNLNITGTLNVTGTALFTTLTATTINQGANNVLDDSDFGSGGLMKTDGAGTYSIITDSSSTWDTALQDIVTDTSPQLGGDLDTNNFNITLDSYRKLCFDGATCSKYIHYNGSGVVIVG